MFFNKKRVEEDLDRIRRANLPNKNETNNKDIVDGILDVFDRYNFIV